MTPSGKFEFYSKKAASDGQSPVAAYIPPAHERIKGGHDTREAGGAADKKIGHREESPAFDSGLKDLPYYFITPHSRFRIHSQFQHLSKIKALHPHPVALMHPEEAAALGLEEGEPVEIYNERGAIRARLMLEPRMRRDVVAVESGWNIASGACANFLTSPVTTDMGESAAFYDCRVGVRRIGL
jgi:anaerobic selenocysteine-containing dehydrogenase